MGYSFQLQSEGKLLLVVVEGTLTLDEEEQLIRECGSFQAEQPSLNVLMDRRNAKSELDPRDVQAHIGLVRSHVVTQGKPKLAAVVSTDYYFSLGRMFELLGGDQLPHRMRVFRSLEDACHWLNVDPEAIVWP